MPPGTCPTCLSVSARCMLSRCPRRALCYRPAVQSRSRDGDCPCVVLTPGAHASSLARFWFPSTDPGWTPLFLLASGLVMETGGYLSHGAIVVREYGIPAVLNIPLATQRIPDGSSIRLDGAQGVVHLLAHNVST